MKYRAPFSLVTLLLSAHLLNAQYTDTIPVSATLRDTLVKPAISRTVPAAKNHFSFRPYIVPSVLIVYGVVSLHTDVLQDVNESIKKDIYTERQPRKITADNYLQYAPAAAVYALNAAGVHGANNFRDRTIIYGISSLIMGTTVYAVKNITKEPRPDGSNDLSFPSGHTATAFASAEFLRQEYKNVSPWYGIAGYAAATVTGYLRLYNNKHWLGDVIAGAGVGIISTKLAYWMYPAIKRKLFKNKNVNTVVLPAYENGSWGLGLVRQF